MFTEAVPPESRAYFSSKHPSGWEGSTSGSNPISLDIRQRQPLREQVNRLYWGLDKWMAENNQGFIVDAYLQVPPQDLELVTPEAFIIGAKGIRDSLKRKGLDRLTNEYKLLFGSLLASETFLDQRFGISGIQMSFPEYYGKVAGDVLQPMSAEDLEQPRVEFLHLLSAKGFSFDPDDVMSVREAYGKYHSRHKFSGRTAIETAFRNHDSTIRRHLSQAIDARELEDFDLESNWREEEAPWLCWFRIVPGEDKLSYVVDKNKTKINSWTWGTAERYPLHEGSGHGGMVHLQRLEAERSDKGPLMDVIPIPDPRHWVLEGVAQTLDELADIPLTLDGKLSVALYRMYVRARSQASFLMEFKGRNPEDVATEMFKYTPDRNFEEIVEELEKIKSDPFWRAYSPIYGRSDVEMLKIARGLQSAAKNELLQRLYREPMSRTQAMRFVVEALLS